MTIKEIAKLAGVSSAAVSRYLNGGYISAEKKEQIRRVIEETGYRPSAQARILRTKKAQLVGVVVPKINSESISRITAGIEKVLSGRQYRMLLASTGNQAAKEVEYMELFENYPVDGIILIGTIITAKHRKFLRETKVPVVMIGQRTKYANCIYHDDYGAGKAMGYAVATKYGDRVAYVGVTREDKAAGSAREDGFLAGLKAVGVELPENRRRLAEFTLDSGYRVGMDLLERESDIDIISCATDTIAAGVMRAVQERELPVRVSGFGDNKLLKAVTGGIPTIHFGYMTSGIRGAELLLDVIERNEKIPVEIKLGYQLVGIENTVEELSGAEEED